MEKTAIQQLFSELENLHPHLFNIYSTEGREFINHFYKFLEIEKQQIIDAYDKVSMNTSEQYYNETFNN